MKAIRRVGSFVQDIREELARVTWPTREDILGSGLVVFVGVALLASYISVCDFFLSNTARLLLK